MKKDLRELPYLTVPDTTIIQENETQNNNGLIHTPQFRIQDDHSLLDTSDIVLDEVNPEIVIGNEETIVPYPQYYERRRREKPLELEVNQNSQETIVENVTE